MMIIVIEFIEETSQRFRAIEIQAESVPDESMYPATRRLLQESGERPSRIMKIYQPKQKGSAS